jgi:glycosyltransferase involved in cell wall biosynthesis
MTAAAPGVVLVAHPSPDLYGSDRMLLESVEGLRAAGWRVVVTVPIDGPLVAELDRREVEVEVLDVPVLRRAVLTPVGQARAVLRGVRAVPAMRRLLRRHRPDIIYVNTVTIPIWLLLRLTGRPVLAHVHEAEQALPRVVRTALALPLLLASSVVVNSRATAEVVRSAVPSLGRRFRLIHNGVPGPARPILLAARPAVPARLVVVGRLSRRKGCDVALDAVVLLRQYGHEVVLDFVGSVFPGYEWYEAELRDRVAGLGLQEAVRFRGFLSPAWPAYADADIAVVPSFGESFGNAAAEGQLAGRPVVVSGVQGLLEIVDDGATGIVVPAGDPHALADGIAGLLEDWDKARELAAAGRAEAERRFGTARYRREIAAAVAALLPAARTPVDQPNSAPGST